LGCASNETKFYVSKNSILIDRIAVTTHVIKVAQTQLMLCNINVLTHFEIKLYKKI